MFTGHLPFEHAVRDNLGFTLKTGPATLAEMFRAAGYKTAGFVSAYVLRPETGIARGFDVYDATFPPMAADRSVAQVQRPGPQTLAAADAWLSSLTSDRFFLFLHLYEPHKPYRAPERFGDLAAYDGEVAFADEIVGTLFTSLKSRGWYDNATIVVLADHGEGLGDHIEEEHGLFLYDEVIRVPWIVRLPGAQSAGRRVKEPVQHIDLLPTLAALAGLAAPPGLRGRDLSVALQGRGTVAPQGIYAEALYPRYHFGWSELVSLTDDRFRYIKAPREELYDLERDPGERTNIAAERGQAATALRSALDALVAGRDIDSPSVVSDEDRQRLAALGYVGTQSAATVKAGDARADPKDKAPLLRAYRQAVERIGEGRLEEGTSLLRAILDDDPAMTDVWSQYAATLGRMGRYQEAFEAYTQVIKLQPEEANGAARRLEHAPRPQPSGRGARPCRAGADERAVAGTSSPRPDCRGSQARRRGAAAGRARRRGGRGAADAGLHPRHDCLQQPAVRARDRLPARSASGLRSALRAGQGSELHDR